MKNCHMKRCHTKHSRIDSHSERILSLVTLKKRNQIISFRFYLVIKTYLNSFVLLIF